MAQAEVIGLYREILKVTDVAQADINELLQVLQPDSLLERFAYRKQANMGTNKEFIKLKGSKGQVDHSNDAGKVVNESEVACFKCLHYSVTESSGTVEITILNKRQQEMTIGVRTVEDTATSPKYFTRYEEEIYFQPRDTEKKIQIEIIDDDEWNPDLDFFVEIYDISNNERLSGDDTKCKVTILDEDFPGNIGFEASEIKAHKTWDKVDVVVTRSEGCDGKIACMIKTEPLTET